MPDHANKTRENQSRAIGHQAAPKSADRTASLQFVDNRQETAQLKTLQSLANNSPQTKQTEHMLGSTAQRQEIPEEEELQMKSESAPLQRQLEEEEEELLQGKFETVQRQEEEEEELLQGKFSTSEPTTQLHEESGPQKNETGLPDSLKAGIEQLSGTSMDDVKVHYNSAKPAQLNALAYAQGSNIHLSPGQEKHLPHEAWHIVQQKQGKVKPTMQAKGVSINDDQALEHEADVMGAQAAQLKRSQVTAASKQAMVAVTPIRKTAHNNAPIQRKRQSIIVTGVSHLVKMEGKTIYGGTEEREIIHGQQLVIDDSIKKRSRRGPNQEEFAEEDKSGPHHYAWFKVISIEGKEAPANLFIREDVFVPMKKGDKESKLDQVTEAVEAVTDVPATLIGNEGITGLADALNDKTVFTNTGGGPGATESDKQHAANMGIVGDSITGVTGILGLAKGFKDLGDPNAKAADLIETALTIEQGAMKTGEAVSKLTHTASGSSSPTTASKFGSAFEGYGAAFSGLKEGFMGMRKVVTLINEHQDYSTEDKAKQAGEIALHALESAKSVVLSVKAFIELVNGAASGGLMAAVPGLDIAVSAGKLIMDGYYLAMSNNNRKVMNERRKQIVASKGADLSEAATFYRTVDAEIVNKKQVIKDDQERIEKAKSTAEKKRLQKRVKKLQAEITTLETQKASDGLTREDVAEYAMATEFRDANTKRVTRQAIHIATEMTKIAGSVATLTGVGAMGGAITKGAATAVELSLPATRLAKQAGRNRAARKMAKGKLDKSMFDVTKSSAAKEDHRLKQVKHLIKLIIDASYKDPKENKADFKNIINYLKATGVSTDTLFKKNGDPQTQLKMLVDAISEREFI